MAIASTPARPPSRKLLQACGYQTALFGKWHLKSEPQGFDTWMVLPGQGAYYNPEFITPSGKQVIKGHCTQVVTELAIDWLKEGRDPDRPFLVDVSAQSATSKLDAGF